jgi:NADH:ubiquinone oxidoreductase subunit 6 (subunit J)
MILLTLSAIFIAWAKHPIHAVLGLILVFINIAVLFIFVIMLLNLRSTELTNRTNLRNELLPFFLTYVTFVLFYLYVSIQAPGTQIATDTVGEQTSLANTTSFITIYLYGHPTQLILLTILLFLAIVAPIAIASKKSHHAKKQELFLSMTRETNTVISIK